MLLAPSITQDDTQLQIMCRKKKLIKWTFLTEVPPAFLCIETRKGYFFSDYAAIKRSVAGQMFAAVRMQLLCLQTSERVLFPTSATCDWNTCNFEEAQCASFSPYEATLVVTIWKDLRGQETVTIQCIFIEMNVEPDDVIAIATRYIACYCKMFFWKKII